jgi:hypothetical protein
VQAWKSPAAGFAFLSATTNVATSPAQALTVRPSGTTAAIVYVFARSGVRQVPPSGVSWARATCALPRGGSVIAIGLRCAQTPLLHVA